MLASSVPSGVSIFLLPDSQFREPRIGYFGFSSNLPHAPVYFTLSLVQYFHPSLGNPLDAAPSQTARAHVAATSNFTRLWSKCISERMAPWSSTKKLMRAIGCSPSVSLSTFSDGVTRS